MSTFVLPDLPVHVPEVMDAITITTTEQANSLRFRRELLRDALEEVRKDFLPTETAIRDALNTCVKQRKAHETPILQEDELIKAALDAWETERLQAHRQLEAQLDDIRKSAEAEGVSLVLPTRKLPSLGGTIVKSAVVTDPAKVKREYMVPDMKKINAAAKRHGKEVETIVGGVVYVEEVSTRRRTRRQ